MGVEQVNGVVPSTTSPVVGGTAVKAATPPLPHQTSSIESGRGFSLTSFLSGLLETVTSVLKWITGANKTEFSRELKAWCDQNESRRGVFYQVMVCYNKGQVSIDFGSQGTSALLDELPPHELLCKMPKLQHVGVPEHLWNEGLKNLSSSIMYGHSR